VPLSLLSIKELDVEEEEVGRLEEDKTSSGLFSKCCMMSAATGNELLDAECFSNFSMEIVELEEERRSCVCGGGGEGGKDVVEAAAAAAAMAAAVATALLVNIGAVIFVSGFVIFEDEGRRGKFVLAGTSTTTGVFANADRALEDIGFTAVVADFGMVVGA